MRDGKMMQNNIQLRILSQQDYDDYIKLQKEVSPFRSAFMDIDFCIRAWNDMFESGRLVYAIQDKAKFCGYCAIKDCRKEKPEIEIELLKEYRKKGIGYTALCLLINKITNEYKVTDFVYCTDSDNYASQALVQKLGGKPNGLKRFFFLCEEEVEKFEKEHLGLIDNKLTELAREFNVEPRKLLTHILVYHINVEEHQKLMNML